MSSVEIIPAVLPQSFKDMEAQLLPLAGVARQAQVDVVDGRYCHGKSWPYRDRASFERLVEQEHGLPFWDKIDFQFDLMVEDPAAELNNFLAAGATQVILHVRSHTAQLALQALVDLRTNEAVGYSVRAGVALGPQQSPDVLEPFESQFDFVQVMGIDREGRQGEPFDIKALYFYILKHDPKNPAWEDRDRLLLSNGHVTPVRYAAMAHAGYFPVEECLTLRKFGSRLQGHPEPARVPGLDTTSGP